VAIIVYTNDFKHTNSHEYHFGHFEE